MSDLTRLRVRALSASELEIEILQIHPDAAVNPDDYLSLSNDLPPEFVDDIMRGLVIKILCDVIERGGLQDSPMAKQIRGVLEQPGDPWSFHPDLLIIPEGLERQLVANVKLGALREATGPSDGPEHQLRRLMLHVVLAELDAAGFEETAVDTIFDTINGFG